MAQINIQLTRKCIPACYFYIMADFITRFRYIARCKSYVKAMAHMVTIEDVESLQKGAYGKQECAYRLTDAFIARTLKITVSRWRTVKRWVMKASIPSRYAHSCFP